ncbi:MAG: sugar phosphate isomerase/epimerase [Acidobacteriales bacterium]|nr:MAG: sugar phosphate isomerase/epimerase [Terriglobales bacterium]
MTEVINRMGLTTSAVEIRARAARAAKQPFDLLECAHTLGLGGAQIRGNALPASEADRKAYRQKLDKWGMYLHGDLRLPRQKSDVADFERAVRAHKEAGTTLLGTAMTGRRYEVFDSLEAFRKHKDQCMESLRLAEPVMRAEGIKLAFENHKDWRWQEQVTMIKQIGSEWIGARVDVGNNISLCDDPMELVEGLAPYAFSCHIKDMAVEEYPQGFLLSEVALGEGILDLPKMVQILRKATPGIKFLLEMITRDPLQIPVYTEKYWVSFASADSPLNGRDLARTLAMVRAKRPKTPLQRISQLSPAEQLKAEDENNRRCIEYASGNLQL